jgi:hypothetical protein
MDTKTHVTRTVSLPDRPRFVDLYQLLRHEWQAFPTLGQSQTHDLKFDDGSHRVWVSRMRPVDHETAEQEMAERVLYEHNDGGRWVALDRRGRRA